MRDVLACLAYRSVTCMPAYEEYAYMHAFELVYMKWVCMLRSIYAHKDGSPGAGGEGGG